jgi:hypothetical protein
MVRQWVLERLTIEEKVKSAAPLWAQELEQKLMHTDILLAMAA